MAKIDLKSIKIGIEDDIEKARNLKDLDDIYKKYLGKKFRSCCESVLDYIAGMNSDRELTTEQIDEMEVTFGGIAQLLRANRPQSAKVLIEQIVVDDVLVTEEMKQDILEEFAEYGI